jgi:hypothetical protein
LCANASSKQEDADPLRIDIVQSEVTGEASEGVQGNGLTDELHS